ncbi:hypothetical protein, partial [Raoultella ornithinolytica]|uniref:hypothetical protein n=1 Tax=Raoultella ornithinolytica TaxID=54291 RepID=UPI001954A30C
PSFLPAEADDLIGTDPGAGSELLVYARPVAAPAATPYRLHAALAAGLAAQAVQFLTNAGIVTVLDQQMWNTSAYLTENSLPGRVLHALVGYT